MKKLNVFAGFFLTFMFFLLVVSAENDTVSNSPAPMPENIKAIIDKSCFGCHNTDSRNDKAKEKLDFKTFNDLTTVKKVGAYNHMLEVLEKSEMPPEKFLERFPDRKLSEEETKLLTEWIKKEASSLIGTN